jgi:hypothetical protein
VLAHQRAIGDSFLGGRQACQRDARTATRTCWPGRICQPPCGAPILRPMKTLPREA